MKAITKAARGTKCNLFAELSEGMAALAQARLGQRNLRARTVETIRRQMKARASAG